MQRFGRKKAAVAGSVPAENRETVSPCDCCCRRQGTSSPFPRRANPVEHPTEQARWTLEQKCGHCALRYGWQGAAPSPQQRLTRALPENSSSPPGPPLPSAHWDAASCVLYTLWGRASSVQTVFWEVLGLTYVFSSLKRATPTTAEAHQPWKPSSAASKCPTRDKVCSLGQVTDGGAAPTAIKQNLSAARLGDGQFLGQIVKSRDVINAVLIHHAHQL